jgi:hypothetical protein
LDIGEGGEVRGEGVAVVVAVEEGSCVWWSAL